MIKKILKLFRTIRLGPFFGFVHGHSYLTEGKCCNIKRYLLVDDQSVIKQYEKSFASLIGNGQAISFASGRMGFFSLLKAMKCLPGDEVILLGATCSVMANAVLRFKALPVYADVDPETFGSSLEGIKKVFSSKTKVIVAQHSFGIPCDILPIVEFAKQKGVYLIEDCALTVGSSRQQEICGNFGDAAIFSTDHTKPINTMIGGLVYTNSEEIEKRVRDDQANCQELSTARKMAIWYQFRLERVICNPSWYGWISILNVVFSRVLRLTCGAFLTDDYAGKEVTQQYPYPAKLPTFLAQLGLDELENWERVAEQRREHLFRFCQAWDCVKDGVSFPKAYYDREISLIPLRIVWSDSTGKYSRDIISSLVDIEGIWFTEPLASAWAPLAEFGYVAKSCPISERLGQEVVNLPCLSDKKWSELFIKNILQQYGVET
jgi:perosamine synthetase